MKRIIFLIAATALTATLVSGGTWAWLSDSETSANNSLTAYIGTFDLTIDGGNQVVTTFNESGIKPGDSGNGTSVLANEGSVAGILSVNCSAIANRGSGGNTEFEDLDGQLGEMTELSLFLDLNRNAVYDNGDIALLADGTAMDFNGSYTEDSLYSAINNYGALSWNDLLTLNPDAIIDFVAKWRVPEATGNSIEGDSVSFDFYFTLNQLPEPDDIIIDGIVEETAWREWFTDTQTDDGSFDLHFTSYWYVNDNYLYLAVRTLTDETTNPGKRDIVQWYIDAGADGLNDNDRSFWLDTWQSSNAIQGMTRFRNGQWEQPVEWPDGVEIAADETGGFRSFEVKIPLSLLADPDTVKIQCSVIDYARKHWGNNVDPATNVNPDMGNGFSLTDSTWWRYLELIS